MSAADAAPGEPIGGRASARALQAVRERYRCRPSPAILVTDGGDNAWW